MKTKVCCMNNCDKEADGYYTTSSSGLWLCEQHKRGDKKKDISEVRDNPECSHLHDME